MFTRIMLVLGLLLIFSDLTEITAKDTKKKLEDRVVALETQVKTLIDVANDHAEHLSVLYSRTEDLNDRLSKIESEDNKVKRANEGVIDRLPENISCGTGPLIDGCLTHVR